jgi:predicted DNA-binding protein
LQPKLPKSDRLPEHLEDLEDIYLATSRLEKKARTYSAEDVKRELDL